MFEIEGALYAQQNSITFACGQVALRTALSILLPQGDITYAEINELAGIVPDRSRNSLTVNAEKIERVLDGAGIRYRKLDATASQPNKAPHFRTLYGFIESGCPSLLAFAPESNEENEGHDDIGHIVPVLGHTFNEDTWIPYAQSHYFHSNPGPQRACPQLSSENWLGSYFIHDDCVGAYHCVPRFYLHGTGSFLLLYGLHPHGEALSYCMVEEVSLEYLNNFVRDTPHISTLDWYNRFADFAREQKIILRTHFISKADYIQHLNSIYNTNVFGSCEQENKDPDAQIISNYLRENLPEYFWMTEISCPELFSVSRSKFGEVLLTLDVDSNLCGLPVPCFLRLPGIVLFSSYKLPSSIKDSSLLF
jgi:hypothetical protein